jgi:hypothetical protein
MAEATQSGLPGIGEVDWGKHICFFYRTRREVADAVVQYLTAGLKNNERCIFGAGTPFHADEVLEALSKALRKLKLVPGKDQLSLFDHHDWYTHNREKDPIQDLLRIERQALRDGYQGLRCGGMISWITRKDWKPFFAYEANVTSAIQGRRILAMCSYNVAQCEGEEAYAAVRTHHYSVAKREKVWDVFKTTPVVAE